MREVLIPALGILLGIGLPCSIPIVLIVLHHQRKMAEIMYGRRSQIDHEQFAAMQREVGELKAILHNHVLAAEGLSSVPSRVQPEPMLQRTLSE